MLKKTSGLYKRRWREVYDAADNYRGHVEASGNIYDETDTKVGTVLLTQEGTSEFNGVYLYEGGGRTLGANVEALHVVNPGSNFYHTEAAGAAFLLLLR